jgi:hypothetical protein
MKVGDESVYEILTTDIQAEATGNGAYLSSFSVRLQDELPLGIYNDTVLISGKNNGNDFTLNVPLSFAVTKYEQRALTLYRVRDKVFGDKNFLLSASGGNGSGKITYDLISGNANLDKSTGEVEITGAGNIVS